VAAVRAALAVNYCNPIWRRVIGRLCDLLEKCEVK